ncbi:MAG: hypothetical protein FWC73_13070 [Defluviitaleaceae bacterium]|nr:hypothetical protein [Defluviitaleaceae bacterium]
MRNSPDRAENRGRFYAFSATGWTDFELIRYISRSVNDDYARNGQIEGIYATKK